MSRIGKKPIEIPSGVTVTADDAIIDVSGPKGKLSRSLPHGVEVSVGDTTVTVSPTADDREGRALHGLMRTLINNMVVGVSDGFRKELEIVGVGYRGEIEGNQLRLHLGFSQPIEYEIAEGVSVAVEKQTRLTVSGIDKELVGKVAADIRDFKKPEPYKGKGIRYAGEYVRRKVGKSAGA